MKKLLGLIIIILLALPAFAQDDFGGFIGGFDGVLSGNDLNALLGGGGNRGGGRGNNNNIPIPEDMLLQVKELLKARNVPLSKDQEKALKPFLQTEIKAMQEYLDTQFGNRGNNNRGNNNQANILSELFPLIAKHNTELLTAMKADLTPDQAPLIAKAEKDKKTCLVMLDLFNPEQQQFGNRGNRGGNNNFLADLPDRPFCTSTNSTTADRLAPVSKILSKGKNPLTADQEKKFSGLIEARLAAMEEELRATNSQLGNLFNQNRNNNNNNNNPQQLRNNIVNTVMSQLGIPNTNNNNNRGGRGGGNNNPPNAANAAANPAANPATAAANTNNAGNARGGNRGNNNFNPQAEIQKKNEELYDKVAAMLDAEQGKVIKKYKYDQIKAKGGAERYRAILEEEGTPLTPEQLTQIQNLFNGQNQAIRAAAELLVQKELDAAGPQAAVPPQNQQNDNGQQNRGNTNNVNQNPLAQQIVAKVMPQVSVQRARLEKVTQDTIMKTLTPPQVASYKLNSL